MQPQKICPRCQTVQALEVGGKDSRKHTHFAESTIKTIGFRHFCRDHAPLDNRLRDID